MANWRLAPSGVAHYYRSDEPFAIPACSTAVRLRQTSFDAAPGSRLCRTCARIHERAERSRAQWEAQHRDRARMTVQEAIRSWVK